MMLKFAQICLLCLAHKREGVDGANLYVTEKKEHKREGATCGTVQDGGKRNKTGLPIICQLCQFLPRASRSKSRLLLLLLLLVVVVVFSISDDSKHLYHSENKRRRRKKRFSEREKERGGQASWSKNVVVVVVVVRS